MIRQSRHIHNLLPVLFTSFFLPSSSSEYAWVLSSLKWSNVGSFSGCFPIIIPRLRFAGIKGQQMRKVQLPAESPCGRLWRRRDSTRSRRMGRRPHRFRVVISYWQTWWVSRRRPGRRRSRRANSCDEVSVAHRPRGGAVRCIWQ